MKPGGDGSGFLHWVKFREHAPTKEHTTQCSLSFILLLHFRQHCPSLE
jgi:hypothetical protein